MRKLLLGILLLITVVLGIGTLLSSRQSPVTTAANQLQQPDAVMENVVATIISKTGKPALKIETPKMLHYADKDTTNITQPHVTVYRQSTNPWTIDSALAEATNGISQIIFKTNVVIHHPNDSTNPTTTLKTASLTIFPNQQIARTGDAVILLQPDTTIHAVGMLANLDEGTIKLLSQAQGDYAPEGRL